MNKGKIPIEEEKTQKNAEITEEYLNEDIESLENIHISNLDVSQSSHMNDYQYDISSLRKKQIKRLWKDHKFIKRKVKKNTVDRIRIDIKKDSLHAD